MNKAILAIDDDQAIRKSFVYALEETDFNIEVAESGEIGINKIKTGNYQLVFLDLKMPGMNGVETLKKIRETHPDLTVYIVTAFHPEYFAELKPLSTVGIGFELLNKPVGAEEIIEVAMFVCNQPAV
ncbi:Mycobacterial persistence regulator A [Legionella massiliensis]|uniref:Mycobacterial persistence regulator A n=1 Tax=Legionella massiliensis TaxID=1034943 RepID=A0A078KR10_9GAMM|nr:response regulator [Legionella massiliensis]CDZ76855.1 Mycobacterial persistence regulator A [Legionella massiliensis]CEE12593.1 Response regulator MprA [Legionella massiliensis]